MTKEDYELIASSIARTGMAVTIGGSAAVKAAKEDAVRLAAIDLATTLRHDNPRFDRDRFLKACGVRGLAHA